MWSIFNRCGTLRSFYSFKNQRLTPYNALPSLTGWNSCLTLCKFVESLPLQFLFILQRLAFMTSHKFFPACLPFVNRRMNKKIDILKLGWLSFHEPRGYSLLKCVLLLLFFFNGACTMDARNFIGSYMTVSPSVRPSSTCKPM